MSRTYKTHDPIAYARKWKAINPDRVAEYRRKERERVKGNLALKLLRQSQTNAHRAGLEWSLTIDDIVIPDVCPVFKVPFTMYTQFAASVDRIDSSQGYISGNIQIISKLANSMKQNATLEQLKQFGEWAISYGS